MRLKTDSLNLAMETVHSASYVTDSISQDYQNAKNRAANLSKELKSLTKEFNTFRMIVRSARRNFLPVFARETLF